MRYFIPLLLLVACTSPQTGDSSADTDTSTQEIDGLLGILVLPERVVVPVGEEIQLNATGLLEDRKSADLTAVVDWYTDNSSVATISAGFDAEGRLTGASVGQTTAWASANGIDSVPVSVEVIDAQLLGLTVGPESIETAVGQTVQLSAQAAYSDGTRADAAGLVQWFTGDGEVAQIASGGVLTASGLGQTTVHATHGDLTSADIPVTVVDASQGADLVVTGTDVEASGGIILLTVVVENQGDVGASDFYVDGYLDPTGTPEAGDYGEDYQLVDYLGPGEETLVTLIFETDSGPHSVAILADSGGDVDEGDETNNVESLNVTVVDESPLPNIEVTYFDYLSDDESIYYALDIRNNGTLDVGAFKVELYVDLGFEPTPDDVGDQVINISGLHAGETKQADFLVENTCLYTGCTSWVLVDSYGNIEESNEDDNAQGPMSVD